MANNKASKKFKVIEENATNAPVKNIEWEGEEVGVESTTKLEQDTGTGQEIVVRFFTFAANPDVFKQHKPTAQELFESHQKGMEAILWNDGLIPYQAIQPRLLFAKDMSAYRFVVSCIPSIGNSFVDKSHTLTELLKT